MLWTFDKLVVPTGLVAAMIRLGNLMNHEIYGYPTDLPWGFRFIENLHAWKMGAEPIFYRSQPSDTAVRGIMLPGYIRYMHVALLYQKEWKRKVLFSGSL